jgi:hypothetical protein
MVSWAHQRGRIETAERSGAWGIGQEGEEGKWNGTGWTSSWMRGWKLRGSARLVPRWRRAIGRAVPMAVVARAGTANRGTASGGKTSGRRVEVRGSRRCRGAVLQRTAQLRQRRQHGGGRGGAEPAEKKQRRKKRGMNPGTDL